MKRRKVPTPAQLAEREKIEQAIIEAIAQGLVIELPGGRIALTKKGQEIANAQHESKRSTLQ